jgi:hypothetical protein
MFLSSYSRGGSLIQAITDSIEAELFHIILLSDQYIKIIFQRQIALLITENIALPGLGLISVGVIIEVESFLEQLIFSDLAFPGGIQLKKNAAVLSEDLVYFAHMIGLIPILSIIELVSAIIRTEFLIYPTPDFLFAIQTMFHTDLSNYTDFKQMC